jgi:hypothetical protein
MIGLCVLGVFSAISALNIFHAETAENLAENAEWEKTI